ncbi:protein rep [Paenibacillus polymyxa]|uniref:protein rep n=1 Tax=Paenibacillus polymyxa TaxID=1406 RepID=UPI002AB5C8B7|nr:protein rep [Paenibacillus polymyxa]MDY8049658.1 protein rep [Paenibacillus polymyxa]
MKIEDNRNESDENEEIRLDSRFLRYQMQSAAKYILPHNRVGICLRHQIEQYGNVDIFKHRETQRAFYGGLMVCGSVWVCPVCASKISERRRQELKTAFKAHLDTGGHCTMVTLTFSHSARDKLDDLLIALGKSMQSFSRGKRHDIFRREIGLVGKIRAFEITYGANGWHPHIHLLLMHSIGIGDPWDWVDMEERLYGLWEGACAKNGFATSREHGLKLHDAAEASTYIGKWGDLMDKRWGTDSEMTKANIKKGRSGSMTPFDMLRAVIEDGDLEYEDKYREYAKATKGKQQLVWSPGLKAKYLIEEKTDEEVAAEKVEAADLLGQLHWQEWKHIIKNNLRYQLLKEIEKSGYESALIKIGIRKSPPKMMDS